MNMAAARTAMVDNQIRPADVTRYDVLSAFLNTKREAFLSPELSFQAYGEYQIPITKDRAMISPRSFAKLVTAAAPRENDEILLIGANLGYEAAILAQLSSTVIAVESDRKLAKAAERNLAEQNYDNAVIIGGKLAQGAKKSGPYDIIIFNGAIEHLPKTLQDQLKPDGRIAAIIHESGVFTAQTFQAVQGQLVGHPHFQAVAPNLPGFEAREEFLF